MATEGNQKPTDEAAGELWEVYNAASADWNLDMLLGNCPTLLGLMPLALADAHLEPRYRGRVLKVALYELLERLYHACQQPSSTEILSELDAMTIREALAGAAVVGLLVQSPDDLARQKRVHRAQGFRNKGPRYIIAGQWYPNRVDGSQFSRKYVTRSVESLSYALTDALTDTDFLRAVAGRLGKKLDLAGESSSEPVAPVTGENREPDAPASMQRPIASIAAQLNAYANQPFVERGGYEERFQSLLSADCRRIVLNGGRGNGKTRLALELVSRQPRALADGLYIRASSAAVFASNLRAILASRGEPTDDLFGGLAKLVSAPDAPSFIIIDNVDDMVLLKALPDDSTSVIVITANMASPEYQNRSLEVIPMSEDEAVELATKLLPRLPKGDAVRIAKAVGFRPLAIVHTCGYLIGDSLVTIDEFLADLKADAASTLGIPGATGEQTLTAIYRRILRQLSELQLGADHIAAREVLECVACFAPDEIPPSLLREGTESRLTATKFREALLALEARFLVRVGEEQVGVHPLTQEILRALLRREGKEEAICLRAHRPIQERLRSEIKRKFVSLEVLDLLPHICKVAVGLSAISAEVFRANDVGRTLTVISRSTAQMRTGNEVAEAAAADVFPLINKALGSVFDKDSPPWLTREDVYEMVREIIPSAYSGGSITSETYLSQIGEVLGIENPEDMSGYDRLSVVDLVEFCRAATGFGLSQLALGVLSSQDYRAQRDAEEPADLGDYETVRAEAFKMLGAWSQAEEAAQRALGYCDGETSDPLAIRGTARAFKLLGDVAFMSGHEADASLLERVEKLGKREHDWERDILTAGHLHHFVARYRAAEFLRGYLPWIRLRYHPQLTELPDAQFEAFKNQALDNIRLASEVFDAQDQARDEYLLGNFVRESYELAYDRVLINGLINHPSKLDGIVQEHTPTEGQLDQDVVLQARIMLAHLKVLILTGDGEVDDAFLAWLGTHVETIASDDSSYWYAEIAAIVYLLVIQRNGPDEPEVLAEVERIWTSIGRRDRLDHLVQAAEAWRANDKMAFKHAFAYLLTF